MTTLSKTDAEALIDRLASKELTFGCLVREYSGYVMQFAFEEDGKAVLDHERHCVTRIPIEDAKKRSLGHPILIGDVLEKIGQKHLVKHSENAMDLLCLWGDVGFTKSLQSIFEEAEWEYFCPKSPCCNAERMRWLGNVTKVMFGAPMPEGNIICMKCKKTIENPEPIVQVPKQPHIRELFQFLLHLGL